MTGPSSPAVEYLATFNTALQVGLRNRSRILDEVHQHLHEATMAQWTAMLEEAERRGGGARSSDEELWAEAQRRAVVAFGSPEEVAASFASGLLGAFDRRVAITARRLDLWLAHPLRGAVLRVALVLMAYAVVVALAELFDARRPLAGTAQAVLFGGIVLALARGAQAYGLRGRPEPGFRARLRIAKLRPGWPLSTCVRDEPFTPATIGVFSFFVLSSALSILPESLYGKTPFLRTILLFGVALLVLAVVLLGERVAAQAARDYPGESEADKRRTWRADHPWSAIFLRTLPLPLSGLALLVLSGPWLGPRLALGVLLVGVTALLAVGMRLAQNGDEQDAFKWRMRRSN